MTGFIICLGVVLWILCSHVLLRKNSINIFEGLRFYRKHTSILNLLFWSPLSIVIVILMLIIGILAALVTAILCLYRLLLKIMTKDAD